MPKKIDAAVKERALRMFAGHRRDYASDTATLPAAGIAPDPTGMRPHTDPADPAGGPFRQALDNATLVATARTIDTLRASGALPADTTLPAPLPALLDAAHLHTAAAPLLARMVTDYVASDMCPYPRFPEHDRQVEICPDGGANLTATTAFSGSVAAVHIDSTWALAYAAALT